MSVGRDRIGELERRNRKVAIVFAGVAAGMLGLAYAAVPLYQLFCQVTGFGGTTQRVARPSDVVLDRTISVRFDANVNGLPWTFEPVQRKVEDPGCGAIVLFSGLVRDNSAGKSVSYLEYEAYPEMAEAKMREIGAEMQARFGLDRVAISHRYGRLEVGEISVCIAVASPHRAEAFDACRWAIDRLKEVVPVWKKEVTPTGEYWVEPHS